MSINLLFLEDDLLLGETIQDLLEEEGYHVQWCRNGQDAMEASFQSKFDAYLLDINVPLIDGVSLLRSLREADDTTPAMFLTSHTDMHTFSEAYLSGADDYLKKPFETQELLIRLQTLLRKHRSNATLNHGHIVLDEIHKRIIVYDKEISLSPKEYQLICLLIQHSGETVTKEMIIEHLWSPSEGMSEGAIRVYINRLKHEIGKEHILNVRGFGYKFVP